MTKYLTTWRARGRKKGKILKQVFDRKADALFWKRILEDRGKGPVKIRKIK